MPVIIEQPAPLEFPLRVPVVAAYGASSIRAEVLGSSPHVMLLQGLEPTRLPPLGTRLRLHVGWDRQQLNGRLAAHGVNSRFLVPIAELNVPARQALAYARALAPDERHVVAVHVTDDVSEAEELRRQWEAWECGVELVIIESPFRSLGGPLLAYIDALKDTYPKDTITVVLPEYVPSSWWEHLLHNQTALRLKAALLFHPGVVVTNVPYHHATPRPAT